MTVFPPSGPESECFPQNSAMLFGRTIGGPVRDVLHTKDFSGQLDPEPSPGGAISISEFQVIFREPIGASRLVQMFEEIPQLTNRKGIMRTLEILISPRSIILP